VYLPKDQKILKSRSVSFNLTPQSEGDPLDEYDNELPVKPSEVETHDPVQAVEEQNETEGSERPKRNTRQPEYLKDYVVGTMQDNDYLPCTDVCFKLSVDMDLPQSFTEAENGPHANEWKSAMDSEYDSLMENETWNLQTLPDGESPIGSKWVFSCKMDKSGNVNKFKARQVAQGHPGERNEL
jgi:hypothetical protein